MLNVHNEIMSAHVKLEVGTTNVGILQCHNKWVSKQ